jgi:hypothetical protein
MTYAIQIKDVQQTQQQPKEETKMETKTPENKNINFDIPLFFAVWMWNKEEGHGLILTNKNDPSKEIALTLEKGKEALDGLWEVVVKNKDRIIDFICVCVGCVASVALKLWEEIKEFFSKFTKKEK